MDRRRFITAGAMGLGALVAGPLRNTVAASRKDRPNIVWLVTEDNSARWLRLYDENGAPMPNIERLAAQGLVFNHAFSCAPVCSVARSTIISGCYAPRVGAQYHRRQEAVPMPDGTTSFARSARAASTTCGTISPSTSTVCTIATGICSRPIRNGANSTEPAK